MEIKKIIYAKKRQGKDKADKNESSPMTMKIIYFQRKKPYDYAITPYTSSRQEDSDLKPAKIHKKVKMG